MSRAYAGRKKGWYVKLIAELKALDGVRTLLADKRKVSSQTIASWLRQAQRLGLAIPAAGRASAARKRAPDTTLQHTWEVLKGAAFNKSKAASILRISRGTLDGRLLRCESELGLKVPGTEVAFPDRERQRYRDRIDELGREVRAAHRQINEAEDIRAAVFRLASQPVEPPAWTLKPTATGAHGLPILFTSDFQWGEVIRADELGGVNEFNRTVAAQRYRLLIEKTLDLSFGQMVKPRYDGLLYLRGGDMISGEIHADLRESNDLQASPAVKDLVENECAGLEALLTKFGKVHVVSVPGNHGRMTPKPQSKGYVERNLDTLSAWWLESHWKNEKRITFHTPASGDAVMPVYGWRFLMTHGDRIGSRGGEGFIGAVATITRGMKKLADYYATTGQPIDLAFVGHFHTALELEYGFANGSLPGYSEYARDLRMRPQPPAQWLLFAHPDHMIGARWKILLGPKPRTSA